ncbi:hypothetical protein HG530_009025 [Fusarium avenaceum]|nr:hypothetical protein HG530_009025 [Fusarium avenaceum]
MVGQAVEEVRNSLVTKLGLVEVQCSQVLDSGDEAPDIGDGLRVDHGVGKLLQAEPVDAISSKIPSVNPVGEVVDELGNLTRTNRANNIIAQKEMLDELIGSKGIHQFADMVRTDDHFAKIHTAILVHNTFAKLCAFDTVVGFASSTIQFKALLVAVQLKSTTLLKMSQEGSKISLNAGSPDRCLDTRCGTTREAPGGVTIANGGLEHVISSLQDGPGTKTYTVCLKADDGRQRTIMYRVKQRGNSYGKVMTSRLASREVMKGIINTMLVEWQSRDFI